MMMRAHRAPRRAECSGERRTLLDGDLVVGTAMRRPRRITVCQKTGAIRDVLIERAAQRDVQQLVAAADSEHGNASIDRSIDEGELKAVDDRVDAVGRRMRVLSVRG